MYWGCLQPKNYTIHCPILDTVTLLYIQQHPLVLEAATIMKSWHAAAGSWSFTMLQKSYRQLLYRRDRECSPKIDVKSLIIGTFGHYIRLYL